MKEQFRFPDHLNVRWSISDSTKVIRSDIQRLTEFYNIRAEVNLPEELRTLTAGEYNYTFELVLYRDAYPYLKGDVLGLSKFSYTMRNGKLIYSKDY